MEAGKLTHSHSQPGGMDRTPPGTPKKAGKMLAVRVQMLDDTITMFQVQAKALGRVLFDQVCNQLHLLESDYFGLEYQELGGTKYWLDLEKPLSRQIGLSLVDTLVRFCVKFYTPDPSQLEEEFTRYLFCLQIKRDLSQGLLQCNSNTAALMASYIVQAECGDYVVEDYPDHRYLSSYKFVPNQDQELERKIMENHKKHTGQSPAEADLNLLETARRCELYGIKMHPAKDHEGAPLNLAVAHMGIVVFQNFTKINTFSWAKMRKISFKRKKFLVKLHPEGYGHYKDTVEFFFESRNECKNLWKKCVENHGFFRCSMVKKVPRHKTRVLSRGSSFRYSGRTQKQIVDFVRENYVKRQTFQRSQSFRHSSSAHSSVANVGTSISAHPLLPLGDNAVAGTPASLSCGSMTLTSSPPHTADIHVGGSPSPPLTTSVSPGTSVTSSPQHFYPQEIPYRRAGHQLTKVKHHQVRSHHAISPLQSPTSAATAASNLSANLSNNNSNNKINIHNSDTRNSRISLKSLDYANINDVYSNFYSSLRSLRNNIDNNDFVENETKTEICSLANRSSSAVSKSNESIRVSSKKSKPPFYNKTQEFDRCAWYRSASCKDLCHDENVSEMSKNEENSREYSTKQLRTYRERDYNVEFDSPVTLYDDSRRKCYSAVTSKNPSVDRVDDVITNFKIYSRSYPGTTSSLSIESPERESYNRIIEMMNIKSDSQEEMLLSQDDLSHDSYELLERELYDFDNNELKDKNMGLHSERNRSKSCSWESEGTIKSLSSRSTENILNRDYVKSRENGFWSLAGGRSPKHKSEIDFRSLDRKFPKETRSKIGNKEGRWADGKYSSSGRRKKNREALDCDFKSASQTLKRSENIEDVVFQKTNITSGLGNEITCSTVYREKELYKDIEHESGLYLKNRELKYGNDDEVKKEKCEDERKSEEDLASFKMNLTEEYFTGKQLRVEERKRMERKREKRDVEERFHEGIREKEQKEWEKEKERQLIERRKNNEEKQRRSGDETSCKMLRRASDQANFQEEHFIKFDRVVSNQFGKYSEFLSQKNSGDLFLPEKKFLESEEVVYHKSVLSEEHERTYDLDTQSQNIISEKIQKDVRKAKTFGEEKINILEQPMEVIHSQEYGEYRKNGLTDISVMFPKNGKVLVERTRSDPYNCGKNPKRNVLTHQKSIDLTPQQSEEVHSDYDNEDGFKKTSRSEHDIPYILHKRHCMNGTAKNSDLVFARNEDKCAVDCKFVKMASRNEVRTISAGGETVNEGQLKQLSSKTQKFLGQKFPSSKLINGKKPGVQIINLDAKNDKNTVSIIEPHKNIKVKGAKHSLVKKIIFSESKEPCSKVASKMEKKGLEPSKSARSTIDKGTKESVEFKKYAMTVESTVEENEIGPEPIYAEVCKDTIAEVEVANEVSKIAPEPPKRTSSVSQKQISVEKPSKNLIKTENERQRKLEGGEINSKVSSPTVASTQESTCNKSAVSEPLLADGSQKSTDFTETKRNKEKDRKVIEETDKAQSSSSRAKQDSPLINSVLQRREDSLTLFARTRLGLSEGSAFIPIVRQSHIDSPVSQRRTKSLDAPYVSVHHLPPADAFSSKDDTVDNNEGDMIRSAVTRSQGSFKADVKKFSPGKTLKTEETCDTTVGAKSEAGFIFSQEIEKGAACKEKTKDPLKLEIPFLEGQVMSGVDGTRLLSKIESLEAFDSEGDMDSSKLVDPPHIPSDRLVNLPESVRFPSVRQISGQTSEESADGWDQKEVKVKRRTPRRSVGREEPDVGAMESVVWDSKDDELPDDNVWDDTLVFTGKYEGSAVTDAVIPPDYLKRGSCGQSIDDDNLSTPMKESSPEHWVSVDDLPEALEREEKLLRQKESILREKILNEKLKRELNLDTIGVDGNYHYGCKEGLRQTCGEESTTVKEKFKGHSLDTYELTEKKLRERRTNKNSSLDDHLLGDLSVHNHATLFPTATTRNNVGSKCSHENTLKVSAYQKGIDYVQCRVVNDPTEIDQFGDNDEELEEFFVVLEENLGDEKEGKSVIWDDVDTFRGTLSNEESLISVPEEFKDAEVEEPEVADEHDGLEGMDKDGNKEGFKSGDKERQELFSADNETSKEFRMVRESRSPCDEDFGSPDDHRRHQFSGEPDCHSHTYISPGKSKESRILSASEDVGCLSPCKDSRMESEDRRRLSASEDSRKYSVSESISEGTRHRLSSTEETRRKRASLTKQCSVGEESLSDDLISCVQERSSSFDHDEKDVFESETTTNMMMAEEGFKSHNVEIGEVNHPTGEVKNKIEFQVAELPKKKLLEREIPARPSDANDFTMLQPNLAKCGISVTKITHLEPPSNEREFSKETEDSVDYDEAGFKDIREVVKEKDISDGLSCDYNSEFEKSKLPSSFDTSASSEGEELRFIDENRGSTPEVVIGKSREAMITSIVLVNEGLAVSKMDDKQPLLKNSSNTQSEAQQITDDRSEKLTLLKRISKPKPLTPKPVNYIRRKLTTTVPTLNVTTCTPLDEKPCGDVVNVKNSLDNSQESDIDKLNDFSLISHVQSQIARRNLVDAGKRLKCEAVGIVEKQNVRQSNTSECQMIFDIKDSSEECERIESGLKSYSDESGFREDSKRKLVKEEKKINFSPSFEADKEKKNGPEKEKRSPDQEKRDSGEDGSSSSSAPPHSKRELSSTWKPFLLESSGSSSLEEGWLPPDDNAHLADEEETSSTSNNQQDESYRDEMDCSTGIGYPALNVTSAEMMVSGYGGAFALSRTLSRISERSTSEQERSELEDDLTKLSSHSVSVEEESIMSSDHQPSLSSDSPSPRESTCKVPDLPQDRPCLELGVFSENKQEVYEPFGDVIPPPIHDEDWPSPPSSSDVFDPPAQSHVETFYMEIYPEEACKVVVKEPRKEESSSSDENRTLHDECELLHISSDNVSVSTTTTTQDGTVIAPVIPRSVRTGSLSEDTSIMSTSDWSSSPATKPRNNSKFGTTEDLSDWTKSSALQDSGGKVQSKHSNDDLFECLPSGSRRENQSGHSVGGEVVGGQPDRQVVPREVQKDVSQLSVDIVDNNNIFSSTPLQNGKLNGEINHCGETDNLKTNANVSSKLNSNTLSVNQGTTHSDFTLNDEIIKGPKINALDSFFGQNKLDNKFKNNNNNNKNTSETVLSETEIKKKRYNTDKGYFIVKELMSTERTYKKDLDVINIWFHEEVSKSEDEMPDDVLNGLFNLFDPLSAAHSQFLKNLEQRLAAWEVKGNILPKREIQKIGDIIVNHFTVLPLYVKYLDKHLLVLERLDAAFRKNKKFEQVYRDFELQRVCYLPLSSFIMKPLQRLLHYNSLLKNLIKYYGSDHFDYKDLSFAQNKLEQIVGSVSSTLKVSENFVQLSELQRDMPSFEGLLQGGREFIRQGCLLKHSKKGFQQRMFFLFSDILVYTNRITTPTLQFKVNGQMPLRGVMVEDSEDRIGTNYSFTIYGGNRTLTVAASSQEEKEKWLRDLYEAVQNAKERNDGKMLQYLSLKSCSSSDEIVDKLGEEGNANRNKNSQQRSNTTVHVCWHRNTSTSLQDHLRAFENELSGFLLRKFKNSNGWQKLWVVFTNFCLFFYKANLDESPLASLPLLGYVVTVPNEEDDIRKDYVFKLQFKNHVYFFRAESEYTFSRWMEVISSATKNSDKSLLSSKKDNL